MPTFAENLKTLPGIDALAALTLHDAEGREVARINNQPGSQGSLALYAHLGALHGAINPAAAQAGLLLYAEHTEDARLNPGKHPNIDRLFGIAAGGAELTVRLHPKT